MGCANCKRTIDAVNPTKLPPVILADKSLLARHRDILSLKQELEKHGVDLSKIMGLNLSGENNNSSDRVSTPRTQSHLQKKDLSHHKLNNSSS